jgi:hypothetical protein
MVGQCLKNIMTTSFQILPNSSFTKVHQYDAMRMYPKVSGLVAWSENCKWYISLPLGAVV